MIIHTGKELTKDDRQRLNSSYELLLKKSEMTSKELVEQIRSDQDNPLLLQFFDRFRYRILILGARFWYQNHHPKILIQINNNLKRAFLTSEVVD